MRGNSEYTGSEKCNRSFTQPFLYHTENGKGRSAGRIWCRWWGNTPAYRSWRKRMGSLYQRKKIHKISGRKYLYRCSGFQRPQYHPAALPCTWITCRYFFQCSGSWTFFLPVTVTKQKKTLIYNYFFRDCCTFVFTRRTKLYIIITLCFYVMQY